MVGAAGMSPLPIDLNGKTFADETEEQTRERVIRRFEDIGFRLLNRTAAGGTSSLDPRKRAYAAQFIGRGVRDGLQPDRSPTGTRSRRSPTP